MARIFIDSKGIRIYERVGQGRKATEKMAHILSRKAERNLRSKVQHTEEITPPEAASNFRVVPTIEGYRVANDDPAIIFLEFGYHPGGGQTFIGPYAPFRHALDEMS